jgi:hypothetical protein
LQKLTVQTQFSILIAQAFQLSAFIASSTGPVSNSAWQTSAGSRCRRPYPLDDDTRATVVAGIKDAS